MGMATDRLKGVKTPNLSQARQLLLEHALIHDFRDGLLQKPDRDPGDYFRTIRPEVQFALWAAGEWADAGGGFAGDARLASGAVAALENAAQQFQPTGNVTASGDMNTAYFTLVPGLHVLRLLQPAMDGAQFESLLTRYQQLFEDAAEHVNRTHDYLNPRGMEAVSCLHLYRLTGRQQLLDRCNECLDELLKRQYESGAQPYHTGGWVWGRRPAQVYQMLTAVMMLIVARETGRADAEAYVRRLMDYVQLANNRRAEPFITPFEGLHKCGTFESVGWQWPLAAALAPDYDSLARTSYENWIRAVQPVPEQGQENLPPKLANLNYVNVMMNVSALDVQDVPATAPFSPPQEVRVLPDISTGIVHQPHLDLCATLLTGYSAFAQADCGDVRLYALTVELSDVPTFQNAGTDALRYDWRQPTEQMACRQDGAAMVLQGRVFTKWDLPRRGSNEQLVHARELEVKMTYENDELLLEFHTVKNAHVKPVPNRLLFLLAARPHAAAPRLSIGDENFECPPASSSQSFSVRSEVATVTFAAPDGSALEIVPEETSADYVLAERPDRETVLLDAENDPYLANEIKAAPEGTLRLSFEGPAALDRGRFRIRFLKPKD